MTDFLTRLVTTAYGDVPVMRTRPVAQFEPLASLLPVETPANATASSSAPQTMAVQTGLIPGAAAAPGGERSPAATAPVDRARIAANAQPPARDQLSSTPTDHYVALAERAQSRAAPTPLHATIGAGKPPPLVIASATPQDSPPPFHAAPSSGNAEAEPATLPVAPTLPDRRRADVMQASESSLMTALPLSAVALSSRAASRLAERRAPDLTGVHSPASTTVALPTLAQHRAGLSANPAVDASGDRATVRVGRPTHMPTRTPPDSPLRAAAVEAESSASPTPMVRVTIGRIIVQAEPAKPAQRSEAPVRQSVTPALSLDRYLQARNGGGQ